MCVCLTSNRTCARLRAISSVHWHDCSNSTNQKTRESHLLISSNRVTGFCSKVGSEAIQEVPEIKSMKMSKYSGFRFSKKRTEKVFSEVCLTSLRKGKINISSIRRWAKVQTERQIRVAAQKRLHEGKRQLVPSPARTNMKAFEGTASVH